MAKTPSASLPLRARAALELRRRRAASPGDPAAALTFREFVDQVNPRYRWYAHNVRLAEVLQRVADGELRRLMVFMPPRHGKSEEISRLFTAYYLHRHPERFVGISSYAAELAYTFSRAARENYLRAGGALKDDAAAVKHWETREGGGLWAAGVGGPITGKGFHLGVIDDPIKNAEEAASPTIQEKHRDWYSSTFYTREAPDSAIVVVLTRWHEADLAGWLLEQESGEESGEEDAERWHIVNFEAIKEEEPPTFPPTCTVEPDPRAPGEPLCPERYPAEKLQKIARRIGSYFWNALFQQRPRPKEGDFFKREWFEIVDAIPAEAKHVRWWDRAGTSGGGDWTAGVRMARAGDTFIVVDVTRGQWSGANRDAIIRQTAALDGADVDIWSEQEPGSSGKDVATQFVQMLAGYRVHAEPSTGSKETRAGPFAAQAEAGNVKLLRGPWNKAYLDELCDFPRGKNDDQVDGSSGAFNKLAIGGRAAPRFGLIG